MVDFRIYAATIFPKSKSMGKTFMVGKYINIFHWSIDFDNNDIPPINIGQISKQYHLIKVCIHIYERVLF